VVLVRDVLGVESDFGSSVYDGTRRIWAKFLFFREGEGFEKCSVW
jgi:hypothetical protein